VSGIDYQGIINLAGGAILAVIGWFARQIWDAVKELRRDLHKIEVALPREYVRKDELGEIKALIQKIFDKLDGKVDK
jgi:hypothetical protein